MANMTLTGFNLLMRDKLKEFVAKYTEKHLAYPDSYPLEISEDNSGIWLEFFIDYCTSGVV